MTLIAREQILPCELPQEEVSHPSGRWSFCSEDGPVLVRGMDMPQHLRFKARMREVGRPKKGESKDDANQRSGAEALPLLLEMTVLAGDGLPVYSYAQWSAFALRHMDEAVRIADVAMRLSGLEKEPGKP